MKRVSLADMEQRRQIRMKCLNMLWFREGMVHFYSTVNNYVYVTRLLLVSERTLRGLSCGVCKYLKLCIVCVLF